MRRNYTINARIAVCVAVMSAFALASNYVAVHAIGRLGVTLDESGGKTAKAMALAERVRTQVYQMRFAQRGISLGLFENVPADLVKARKLFEDAGKQMGEAVVAIRPLVPPTGQALADTIGRKLERWQNLGQEMERLADARDTQGLSKLRLGEVRTLADDIDGNAKALIELQWQVMADAKQEAAGASSRAYAVQIALSFAIVVVGLLIVLLIRQVGRRLRKVATDLRHGAGQVSGSAGQLTAASQSLAQGASEQAASLEETSAATEQVTAMTQKNFESTRRTAHVMTEVDGSMQAGSTALTDMLASMARISESSSGISKIIKVIDEIAFQTNILALNAAVEAARAGEAGLGFAVVADEVRNLAGRCSQAAKDTAGLIDESIQRTHDGSAKLHKLADLVRTTVASTSRAKELVDEVHLATEQQSRGIEQIGTAIAQIEQVTQRIAAAAEEGASSSAEMSSQATALNRDAEALETLVGTDRQ